MDVDQGLGLDDVLSMRMVVRCVLIWLDMRKPSRAYPDSGWGVCRLFPILDGTLRNYAMGRGHSPWCRFSIRRRHGCKGSPHDGESLSSMPWHRAHVVVMCQGRRRDFEGKLDEARCMVVTRMWGGTEGLRPRKQRGLGVTGASSTRHGRLPSFLHPARS